MVIIFTYLYFLLAFRAPYRFLSQVYSFSDPSAGSYGNENFTYMSQYMNWEASLGKRDVMYYGETAYW